MLTADSLQDQQASLTAHPAAGMGQERTEDAPQAGEDPTEEAVQKALVDLVRQSERESDSVRRHHVRRMLQAEEYWRGNQHLIWSERNFRWHTPFEYALEQGQQASVPKFQYVTNIYQSFGLTVIAALSRKLPKVRFQPKSAKSERDIATSRAASNVSELIEDNNTLDKLAIREAYLLWTQGMFGAYVRYVVDKDFGTHEVPQVSEATVKIADDRYICPSCGSEIPAAQAQSHGLAPIAAMACPNCGAQVDERHFQPAEYGTGLITTGSITYPNGKEVITIVGGLNLKLMPHATDAKESGYVIWCEEHHQASLRAAYPSKAKKIGLSNGEGDAENQFERNARISLSDSPPYQRNVPLGNSLVTFTRAWLRNWMLWNIDDEKIRNLLLQKYPNGVYIALAGDEFLEARDEDVDQHWEVCAPMPGQGMYREAVGGSTIPIQQQLNDARNVIAEHVEFGSAPPVLFDARYINQEALRARRMEPASFMPVVVGSAPAATTLDKMIVQPKIQLDANIYQHGKDLIELTQVVSGAMPSLFGGSIQNVDTASGYNMAREQSLGKLDLFWRSVKQFQARLMLKAVEVFRDNRTEDYELVVFGKSGDYSSKWIHLEDLRGNITAHPEADEDFPATWAEIRENIMTLIQQIPDVAGQLLLDPANAPMLRKFIANPELQIPGEDDREKQYREVEQLLQGPPQVDPLTGKVVPTILPDPLVDNHAIHVKTAQEFAVSDEGIEAKTTNPAGYANLMAHVLAHYEAQAQAQMMIQQATGGMLPAQVGAGESAGDQGQPSPDDSASTKDEGSGETVGDKVGTALQNMMQQPA